MQEVHGSFEADYQSFKVQLLRAGTAAKITPRQMVTLLEQMSALRRILDQATKSAFYLDHYVQQVNHSGSASNAVAEEPGKNAVGVGEIDKQIQVTEIIAKPG